MAGSDQFGKSNYWAILKSIREGRFGGLGLIGHAKMTYDFVNDGGAIGLIVPKNSPIIPANSIILGGITDVTTGVTSGGAATISLGTTAGSSAASLKAAVILGTEFAAGLRAVVPLFTAATMFKMTAEGQLSMTVAAFALTGGKFDLNVIYLIGNV